MSNQTQQHEQQSGQAFSQDEFSALLNKSSVENRSGALRGGKCGKNAGAAGAGKYRYLLQ